MPLFSKRSRSLSTTRPTTPASSSAHLAAAQAFAASQAAQSNLSASAAATALRTMSPPPTPVHQIQTKRMMNRQPSNSSITSATRGRSVGNVQRRTSAGSMTERTFRSPSPGQQSPQTGPIIGAGRGAPPVPPLPSYVTEDVPPIPVKSHRRSASMDAPPRVSSPLSGRPAGRGQNTHQLTTSNSAAATAARRSANQPPMTELQRSDSQDGSVNFSYPRDSRPSSPPPRVSSPMNGNGSSTTLQAQGGISATEAARIQSNLAQTAAQPVKKKKKRVDRSVAEGSHLHMGTMGAKPTVTPLEPLPADYEPPVSTELVKRPKKKAALTGQASHFPDHEEQHLRADEASDSDVSTDSPKDRRAMRAAGVLMKQPSVVREDWEGEQEELEPSQTEAVDAEPARASTSTNLTKSSGKKPAPEANMSRKIEDPPTVSKSATAVHDAVTISSPRVVELNKGLSPVNADAQNGRGVSVSPSRSTRFSDRLASDLASGRKHEPLGRSISPAKSALKHSSISSDTSPIDPRYSHRRGSSVTPSEASDVSVDGTSSRKKANRVSFEGFAEVKDSLADVRASKETNKKSWHGFGKGKASNLNPIYADEEVEEGMKPRPALPSFGSVRRSERSASPSGDAQARNNTNMTASSSETSSIADPPTMDTSVSSDHALGGLISRESQIYATSGSHRQGEKTSPVVASTRGYESDSESEYSNDEDQHHKAAQIASQKLGKTVGSTGASTQNEEIPVIAVQPATPGIDELRMGKEWAADVPGGFPGSQTSSDNSLRDNATKQVEAATPVKQGTGLGFVDPPQNFPSSNASDTAVGASAQQLGTIDEEDSDAYSVYSDAAEDLSDLEGDGFGSINAIVESPIVAPTPVRKNPLPESPLVTSARQRPDVPERTTSWEDTQAHWSGLAQSTRNIRQETSQSATTSTSANQPSVVVPVKTKEAKSQTKAPTPRPTSTATTTKTITPAREPNQKLTSSAAATALSTRSSTAQSQSSFRTSMRGSPEHSSSSGQSKPALRSSMRDRPDANISNQQKPAMRTSMRNGPDAGASGQSKPALRSSMRGPSEPAPVQPAQRPVSHAPSTSASRAALQKKNIPPAAAPKAPVRRFSNDSDSDSSFRKARRSRRPADGQYSMKRSMRGNVSEPNRQSAPTLRAGVRSLSPPTDRRPTSPTMGLKSLRTTMRGSADLGTPTLRPQLEQKRSSSLFSRNRTAKSPTRPMSAVPALPSKLKSRIVDSDDEDGPRPTRFKSRFGDSSDEDEPIDLRPVRGLPQRRDGRDSTDLDDSSDEEARRSKATAKKLAISSPPATDEPISPPASPSGAKKRGFWGRLRGKKKDDEESVVVASSSTVQVEDKQEKMKAKDEDYKNSKQLGFDSTAERDAMIEQTRLMLEASKNEEKAEIERPQSPGKLQRRMTPQRVFSDSYAPPKMPAAAKDRPQTSDGYDSVTRPGVGSRQATQERVNGETVAVGKSGKKKKFGFLRKAFGLTD